MYDPLVHSFPDQQQINPETYWISQVAQSPQSDGILTDHVEADIVIIGGGFTGLSCALSLARDHNKKVIVLEARSTAWGCSGRNGSFARISGGRMPLSEIISKFGEHTARAYFNEMYAGLETVRKLIADGKIDCDVQPDGVNKVAAYRVHADLLRKETEVYNKVFDYPARFITANEFHHSHGGDEAFGALHFPDGFSMNPLKLAYGVHHMARSHGAIIHTESPVVSWKTDKGMHLLSTPQGSVTAPKVVVATNGYTSAKLNPRLTARVMPVHSQVIVTEPMSEAQVNATLPSGECMFDTRSLLFYYRRLPDNRLLFGGRSAISGKDAENPKHRQYLIDSMVRKFPSLKGITIDYWWGGWVAVSRNSLPFIYRVPQMSDVFWGGGYAGSGVSFSLHTGTKLALLASGNAFDPEASFLTREPARYPFSPFLRVGQKIAYSWLHAKDARQAKI